MQGMKQVYVTRLSDVAKVDKEGIGTLRQEGNAWYKYCKIMNDTATVAGEPGDAVAYGAAASAYANHLVVIDCSDANDIPVGAGVLCGDVAGVHDVAEYGWVQVKGPAVLNTVVTSGDAGKTFNKSASDTLFTVTADATSQPCGTSLDDGATVILDCPF